MYRAMKKIVLCGIFLFISGFTAITAGGSAEDGIYSYIPYASASWDSKSTTETKKGVIIVNRKVFFNGKKMRTEAEITDKRTGKTTNQVLIMTEKYVFFFDTEKKSGMKISADSPSSPESAMKQSARSRKAAKYLGKGAVDGVGCGIYSYSFVPEGEDEGALMKYTEWRNGDGFAVKTVNEVKNAKTTIVISNLKKNPALSDSLFEPGPDIKIVDMDDMTKRASGIRAK